MLTAGRLSDISGGKKLRKRILLYPEQNSAPWMKELLYKFSILESLVANAFRGLFALGMHD